MPIAQRNKIENNKNILYKLSVTTNFVVTFAPFAENSEVRIFFWHYVLQKRNLILWGNSMWKIECLLVRWKGLIIQLIPDLNLSLPAEPSRGDFYQIKFASRLLKSDLLNFNQIKIQLACWLWSNVFQWKASLNISIFCWI